MRQCGIIRSEEILKDNKVYNYIWIEKNKNSLFAQFRIIRGLNYISVYELLSKPHGLKEIMNEVLALFSKKNKYRWETILTKVPKHNTVDGIMLLNEAGIIVLKEKNDRPAKGDYWRKVEVIIDERAIDDIRKIFDKNADFSKWKEELVNEVNNIILYLDEPITKLDKKIMFYIEQGLEILDNPKCKNKFPSTIKSRQKFKSILLTFAYIRKLVSNNEIMSLRTLSCIIWDDSKIVEKYIKDVTIALGEELINLGITINPEIFYIYGGGSYKYNEEKVSLMSGKPVILSGETILESKFYSNNVLKNIIIVENLTVFSTLLERRYNKREDTILLWSKGHWNSYHKKIVNEIIATSRNKINIYIWCDLDVDGILIAEEINNYLLSFNCIPLIKLMGKREYNMINSKRRLTKREEKLLENITMESVFFDIIREMKKSKTTIEQERFLDYYEYVISNLP